MNKETTNHQVNSAQLNLFDVSAAKGSSPSIETQLLTAENVRPFNPAEIEGE